MANFTENPKLSSRFLKALEFAFESHRFQARKQGEVPYFSHLMQVAGLVLEAGGTEDEAIAALLHDIVEDVGVPPESLIEPYGYTVYSIVLSLTENKILPLSQRKQAYIEEVARTDTQWAESVKLVSFMDKLHNLRCYASTGRSLWDEEKKEFYQKLLNIYNSCDRIPGEFMEEMCNLWFLVGGSW